MFDSQLQYVDDLQETLVPNTNTDEQPTAPKIEVTWTFPGNPAAPIHYVHGAPVPPALEAAVPALPVEPLEQNDAPEPLRFPEPEPNDLIPVDEQIEAPEPTQHELVNEHFFEERMLFPSLKQQDPQRLRYLLKYRHKKTQTETHRTPQRRRRSKGHQLRENLCHLTKK